MLLHTPALGVAQQSAALKEELWCEERQAASARDDGKAAYRGGAGAAFWRHRRRLWRVADISALSAAAGGLRV